jgi:phosphohistidine phosphatase
MDLYIVRHAIAVERGDPAFPGDDDRPLSPEGIHKFRLAARGLSELGLKLKRIVSSPLLRARQTAEILRDAVGKGVEITTAKEMRPETPFDETLKAIMRYDDPAIAVVGHEPHLSGLASFLLVGGGELAAIEFKKGAVARLVFPDRPAPGAATLEWLIQPGALRLLAKD